MSDTIRQIRIIKVPRGNAPEWVRQAWVGCVLPDLGPPANGRSFGLLTRTPRNAQGASCVPMQIALEILAEKSPDAATWFRDTLGQGRITSDKFVFQPDECEVVPPTLVAAADQPIRDIP